MRRRVFVNSVNPVPQSMPVLKLWNDVDEFQAETMTLVESVAGLPRKGDLQVICVNDFGRGWTISAPVAMS